jgi:uncharacterized protein
MNKLTQSIGDYDSFLKTILSKVEAAGFDMADFSQCDHMGYRTTSLEQYEQKKQELKQFGILLGETMVNHRPITTFRLDQPVITGDWRIDALELIAPKTGKPRPEGLDHVEFVLFEGIDSFLQKHSDKTFVTDAADRGINPEIAFRLSDGLTVKFHLLSLPAVVYIEKKLRITAVSNESS